MWRYDGQDEVFWHGATSRSERYPRPSAEVITSQPTSWRTAVRRHAPRRFVLPGLGGEAFWIGLVSPPGVRRSALRVLVSTADGCRVDALVRSGGTGGRSEIVDDDVSPQPVTGFLVSPRAARHGGRSPTKRERLAHPRCTAWRCEARMVVEVTLGS
jgi:hypothetical protein